MSTVFRRLLLLSLLACAAVAGAFVWWSQSPIPLATTPVDFVVAPSGHGARGVARQLQAQGVPVSAAGFYWLARVSGQGAAIKAGSYEIETGCTPWQLLRKLARGDQSQLALTVPEGWTLAQFRAALAAAPDLVHDTAGWSDAELMRSLGAPASVPAEGQFFPDTYLYSRGSRESALLARAYREMQLRLSQAWAGRDLTLPLASPQQALVLASMVEKETGRAADRPRIAEVFINRLRAGMPLQSDPTVIYGLGSRYQGHLHHADLADPSPYNTYAHPGLPPGPIALPGLAALDAAMHPAPGSALYFVARGDGSSAFSDNLAAHDAAVVHYILHKTP